MSAAARDFSAMTPHDGPAMPFTPELPLRAVGWRVLVRLPEVKTKTDSGIIMPEQLAEKEALAVITGEVVNVGEYCYPLSKYPAPWCKAGDWVVFRSYSGTRVTHGGREYRLLADDAIEAVTTAPEEIGRA